MQHFVLYSSPVMVHLKQSHSDGVCQQVNAVLTVLVMRSLYRFYKGFGGEYNIQNDETKAKELVKSVVEVLIVCNSCVYVQSLFLPVGSF